MNERIGLAWFRLGVWKLSGMGRDAEIGRCPVFQENENIVHVFLKYVETRYSMFIHKLRNSIKGNQL